MSLVTSTLIIGAGSVVQHVVVCLPTGCCFPWLIYILGPPGPDESTTFSGSHNKLDLFEAPIWSYGSYSNGIVLVSFYCHKITPTVPLDSFYTTRSLIPPGRIQNHIVCILRLSVEHIQVQQCLGYIRMSCFCRFRLFKWCESGRGPFGLLPDIRFRTRC